MTTKMLRRIINIDEEKCVGCGNCITSCAEGALAMVDGKARLVSDSFCDGLAACLKECPYGAISIVEREAADFDKEAVHKHLHEKKKSVEKTACSCPGSAVREIKKSPVNSKASDVTRQEPMLTHWPVQLALVPAGAKFLENRNAVLIADCVPFTYPNLHQDFLKDHSVLVACPKLDDAAEHQQKLSEILEKSRVKSLTVVRMEVPCCGGLSHIAQNAIQASGKQIPFKEVVISVGGSIITDSQH
jgi:ferredoxin